MIVWQAYFADNECIERKNMILGSIAGRVGLVRIVCMFEGQEASANLATGGLICNEHLICKFDTSYLTDIKPVCEQVRSIQHGPASDGIDRLVEIVVGFEGKTVSDGGHRRITLSVQPDGKYRTRIA